MKLFFNKRFLKDLANIPKEYRVTIEKFVFETLPNYKSLSEYNKTEKIKGFKNYYKIRFGDYRVGLKYENDTLTLERVLHRKEIYRFFP